MINFPVKFIISDYISTEDTLEVTKEFFKIKFLKNNNKVIFKS